jgi:hypothetical protein
VLPTLEELGIGFGHRLEENLGAVTVQPTSDDLREIDRAASEIDVHGARYPEHLQKMVGR